MIERYVQHCGANRIALVASRDYVTTKGLIEVVGREDWSAQRVEAAS